MWESQILCPSYRTKSSKVEHIGVTYFLCVQKHVEAVIENDCKKPDTRYLGTQKLLPRIRAHLVQYVMCWCTRVLMTVLVHESVYVYLLVSQEFT